jgi:hypothetical protein
VAEAVEARERASWNRKASAVLVALVKLRERRPAPFVESTHLCSAQGAADVALLDGSPRPGGEDKC